LVGNAGNDYLSGGAGNDIISGGIGSDTVGFDLLVDDATGGNGTDTWTDFSLVQGDKIDITQLLDGTSADATNLSEYVSLNYNAATSTVTLSIDRDGSGGLYNQTALLNLTNQTSVITLEDLIANQQLLF